VTTILGSSLAFVDGTVVNVALPALQREFGATVADVQWVVEAYALLLSALLLAGGAIGDRMGRRRVYAAGIALFAAASAACGLAGTVRQLVIARAVQGVGAALLVPGSLAIISASFPVQQRGRAIGTWSGFTAMTAALGPVLGGWLIEHLSWRWVFFINLPLAVLIVVISLARVPESRDEGMVQRLDGWGAALATVGLCGITFALIEVGRGAERSLIAGGVGIVALACFFVGESRSSAPMLPLDLFRSRPFSGANLMTLFLYGALGGVLFFLPLDLIQVQHYSATAAGAALLPFPLIMFALSRWSGGLVARFGSRLPLTVGPAIAALGLALQARPGIGGSYWTTFFPAVVVMGFGMAITVAPLTTTVMGAADPRHAGAASGVNNAVSRVAGLLAIAVFGVVLARTFDARVRPPLDRLALSPAATDALQRELSKIAGADVAQVASIAPAERPAVRAVIDQAFVFAFRLVMFCSAALALASAAFGYAIAGRPGP